MNKLKPVIRFQGFTNAWEQRKAKDVCLISTGKSNTQDQNENGKYPFFIRPDAPAKSDKFLYDCEAVITIGDGNIGKVFHYINGKFDLHQRCYKMSNFKDIDGKYFYYFFSEKFYERAIKMTAKATVDSVRLEMISEMKISQPLESQEQHKISNFLTKLDNLITLHQRKRYIIFSKGENYVKRSKKKTIFFVIIIRNGLTYINKVSSGRSL
ncbi:restriction endonuclease subunit S [Campylobacter sp. RM16190]|uniref:restriction endonuclease subunit S n=1 Tax=Campylobacter sp. RM16190 TaxID=1705727 RepID=UPI00147630C4|nr:restriction endonuclease subunit S [Campylobacter sp. RM16190]